MFAWNNGKVSLEKADDLFFEINKLSKRKVLALGLQAKHVAFYTTIVYKKLNVSNT